MAMQVDDPLAAPFAALAAAPCPAYDAMLTAIEREFRAVDRVLLSEQLDDLARPLFGLAGRAPRRVVHVLAESALDALPGSGLEPRCWLLGSALESGRAAAPVRAALAAELGRRAGVEARPARLRGRWLVVVHDEGERVPVGSDVGPDLLECAYPSPACLCGHELAFALLGGLADAWLAADHPARARRAAGLRLLLPLDDHLRSAVLDDLGRYEER